MVVVSNDGMEVHSAISVFASVEECMHLLCRLVTIEREVWRQPQRHRAKALEKIPTAVLLLEC